MSSSKETLTEDAAIEDLVSLVKASQRQKLVAKSGSWVDFMKARGQGGGTDPSKQSREVLEAYVADLSAPAAEGADEGAGAEGRHAAWEFVRRYLKWAKEARRDEAKGRGVLPQPEASTSGAQQPRQQQVTVWSLVRRTRAHAKYKSYYDNMPSYSSGWTRVKRRSLSGSERPKLLALDCEMCATEDDSAALLGVCVVDEFGEVVYRQLVRPQGQIKDLRTNLTGVTEADLEGLTVTAKDAQREVRKLLEGGDRPVVLVGHALYHDLVALRIDHQPVIDTSLVFGFRGLPECIPSLKDLAKVLLGLGMREGGGAAHDSKEDAGVSMRLVIRELQMGGPTPPVDPPQVKVPTADLCKLCVHSLPEGVTEEALREVFTAAAAPVVQSVEGSVTQKQVLLVFKHTGDANDAFKKLPGKQHKDAMGRFFKTVPVGTAGLQCKVRKMASHNGMAFGSVLASPSSRKNAKRARSKERPKRSGPSGSAGAAGGSPGAEAAGAGSERRAKRQKRSNSGGAGGAAAGDKNPVQEAGNKKRAAAGEAAGADGAARAAATPPKVKKEKGGAKKEEQVVPAANGAGAAPAPAANGVAEAAKGKDKKGKEERKRKREKEESSGKDDGDEGKGGKKSKKAAA